MDQIPEELKIGDIVKLKNGRKVQLEINSAYHLGMVGEESDCKQCCLGKSKACTPQNIFILCFKASYGTYFKWVEEDGTEDSQINVDR